MIVLGLTGGIAMGKSTVAAQFAFLGAHVCCADAIVHRLLAGNGEAAREVARQFPKAVNHGRVDRRLLGELVFADDSLLARLEAALHPHVAAEENQFIAGAWRKGAKLVVLDIPLLYETGGQHRCDAVAVASAPAFLQRQRALRRWGMSRARLEKILKRQMPDARKRHLADYVIPTGHGRAESFRCVRRIMGELYAKGNRAGYRNHRA